MKLIQVLFMSALCAVSLSASAQWQWLDKGGHRVFSDRAPPPDIPEKNILKQAGKQGWGLTTDNPAPPPTTAQVPASAPRLTGVDQALQAKKKQTEEAQAAKRKADEDKIASMKADSCARAQQAKSTLASGIRISQINAKGEREYMDDVARAAESKRIQSIIDSDCR